MCGFLWGALQGAALRVCEANWRRSLCAAKRDPRLGGSVLDAPPLSLIAPLRQKVRRHRGQDRGHDTRNRNRKPAHGAFDLAHL